MQKERSDIMLFLIVSTLLILMLAALIIALIHFYQKRQIIYYQKMSALRLDHEKHLMATRLEIQEDTFQQISREIHDNIGLSLSLVKLILNTIDDQALKGDLRVNSAVELLTGAISNLRGISKSLNADVIASYGLLKALEMEIQRINGIQRLSIDFVVEGEPVYLEDRKELIIFRIIKEAINNVLRHAKATRVTIVLKYLKETIDIRFRDNGVGFDPDIRRLPLMGKAGLRNMESRTRMLAGSMEIRSFPMEGSLLIFNIPI